MMPQARGTARGNQGARRLDADCVFSTCGCYSLRSIGSAIAKAGWPCRGKGLVRRVGSAATGAVFALGALAGESRGQECGVGAWVETYGYAGLAPAGSGTGYATEMICWDPDGAGPRGTVVVAGGSFRIAGDVYARNIAMWDPSTRRWSAMGSNVLSVSAMTVDGNGDLVVAGSFEASGDLPLAKVARWDGSRWISMGFPTSMSVASMTTLANGEVLVGGSFSLSETATTDAGVRKLARWDGTKWRAFGNNDALGYAIPPNSTSTTVSDLAVLPNGDVIAAGSLSSYNNLARWDGNAWSVYGGGVYGGGIRDLHVDAQGRLLVAGSIRNFGSSISGGGLSASGLARFDGTSWSGFFGWMREGDSLEAVTSLADGSIVGAGFGNGSTRVGVWNAGRWRFPDLDSASIGYSAVALPDGRALVSGVFLPVDPDLKGICVLEDGRAGSTVDRPVVTTYLKGTKERLIGLNKAGQVVVQENGGARIVTQPQGAFVNVPPEVAEDARGQVLVRGSLSVNLSRPELYETDVYGGVGAYLWTGSKWRKLDDSLTSMIGTRLLECSDRRVVAFRSYRSTPGESPTRRICSWDGFAWTPLGGTVAPSGSGISSLTELSNGQIVAVGSFTEIGGVACEGAAIWNGSEWRPFASGRDGAIRDLSVGSNGRVVILGDFTVVEGVPTSQIAVWDGTVWTGVTPLPLAGALSQVGLLENGAVLTAVPDDLVQTPLGPKRRSRFFCYLDGSWREVENDLAEPTEIDRLGDVWVRSPTFEIEGRPLADIARWSIRPVIERATVGVTPCVGQEAVLRVEARRADGVVEGLTYVWSKDGVEIDAALNPTASTAELRLVNVQQADSGIYRCAVRDGCSSARSNESVVTVGGPDCALGCDSLDFNGDGQIDWLDVDAYFSVLGEGPCLPAGTVCGDLDFNNDGLLGTPVDVDAYFSVLGEGPCLSY